MKRNTALKCAKEVKVWTKIKFNFRIAIDKMNWTQITIYMMILLFVDDVLDMVVFVRKRGEMV